MASAHLNCVSLFVLRTVKDDLEKAFNGHFCSMEEKIQKTGKQWQDLNRKVEVMEGEVRSSKNEVRKLRSALISERKKREKGEDSTQKLTEVIEQLQVECVRLEGKIVEFENGPQGGRRTPSGWEKVFDTLDELVNDTKSNFLTWNGRQLKLEEKMERIEKVLGPFTAPPALPPPPPLVTSAVADKYNAQLIPEEEEAIPSPPPFSSAPPLPLNGHGTENVESSNPENCRGEVGQTEETSVSKSRRGRDRDPRWDLEHGVDPTDTSGKSCLCGSSFSSKAGLSHHIFYFTQEWKFSCQFCKVKFVGYTMLRKHLRVVHDVMAIAGEEKRVGCRQCGAVLKTRLQYKNHLRRIHSQDQGEVPVNSETTGVNTTQQNTSSRSRKRRRPSPDTHRRKAIFKCRFCERQFLINCRLKVHMAKCHKYSTTAMQVKHERVEIWNHE